MSASGRTKVASDVKFGMGASFIKLYLWSKFGDPSSYGVQTQMPSRRRIMCFRQFRQRAINMRGSVVPQHQLCLLFIISQLVRCGISIKDVITAYCAVMRSVLEYACPVWHCGLTVKESSDLEGVQKRVLRIIWPDLRYSEALDRAGLERLGSVPIPPSFAKQRI